MPNKSIPNTAEAPESIIAQLSNSTTHKQATHKQQKKRREPPRRVILLDPTTPSSLFKEKEVLAQLLTAHFNSIVYKKQPAFYEDGEFIGLYVLEGYKDLDEKGGNNALDENICTLFNKLYSYYSAREELARIIGNPSQDKEIYRDMCQSIWDQLLSYDAEINKQKKATTDISPWQAILSNLKKLESKIPANHALDPIASTYQFYDFLSLEFDPADRAEQCSFDIEQHFKLVALVEKNMPSIPFKCDTVQAKPTLEQGAIHLNSTDLDNLRKIYQALYQKECTMSKRQNLRSMTDTGSKKQEAVKLYHTIHDDFLVEARKQEPVLRLSLHILKIFQQALKNYSSIKQVLPIEMPDPTTQDTSLTHLCLNPNILEKFYIATQQYTFKNIFITVTSQIDQIHEQLSQLSTMDEKSSSLLTDLLSITTLSNDIDSWKNYLKELDGAMQVQYSTLLADYQSRINEPKESSDEAIQAQYSTFLPDCGTTLATTLHEMQSPDQPDPEAPSHGTQIAADAPEPILGTRNHVPSESHSQKETGSQQTAIKKSWLYNIFILIVAFLKKCIDYFLYKAGRTAQPCFFNTPGRQRHGCMSRATSLLPANRQPSIRRG